MRWFRERSFILVLLILDTLNLNYCVKCFLIPNFLIFGNFQVGLKQ